MVLPSRVAYICDDVSTCLVREFAMKIGFHSNTKKTIFVDHISQKRIKNRSKDMFVIKEENKYEKYCSMEKQHPQETVGCKEEH